MPHGFAGGRLVLISHLIRAGLSGGTAGISDIDANRPASGSGGIVGAGAPLPTSGTISCDVSVLMGANVANEVRVCVRVGVQVHARIVTVALALITLYRLRLSMLISSYPFTLTSLLPMQVADGQFCEATIGHSPTDFGLANGLLWKDLFDIDYFRIALSPDMEAVELCGALKNIVALGAGGCWC